ncbi:MAG: GNAT family N-acetyltransferase [Anaerolineales bacterium]
MVKSVEVTALQPHEYRLVMQFIQHHPRAHYHLDWEPIAEWLRGPDVIVSLAWQARHLLGVLALSPAHHGHSWIRLLVLPRNTCQQTFQYLWEFVHTRLQPDVQQVAIMTNQAWLRHTLEAANQFTRTDMVINLKKELDCPAPEIHSELALRPATHDDLRRIVQVDHAAFAPMWQMRLIDLYEAHRRASLHEVAVTKTDEIVGYQLSMQYHNAIHLARLAVLPAWRGRGIAKHLVSNLMQTAWRQNCDTVTVNTQLSNQQSQHLYQRLGFQRDHNDMVVYSFQKTDQ